MDPKKTPIDFPLAAPLKDAASYNFPISLAVKKGDWKAVKKIASHRGFQTEDAGLGEALLAAAKAAEWDLVLYLIKECKVRDFDAQDEQGYRTLHHVIKGYTEENHVKIKYISHDKRMEIIEILAENGANLNARTTASLSPLDICRGEQSTEQKLASESYVYYSTLSSLNNSYKKKEEHLKRIEEYKDVEDFLREHYVLISSAQFDAKEGNWASIRLQMGHSKAAPYSKFDIDTYMLCVVLYAASSGQWDIVMDGLTQFQKKYSGNFNWWHFVPSKDSENSGFFPIHYAVKAKRLDVIKHLMSLSTSQEEDLNRRTKHEGILYPTPYDVALKMQKGGDNSQELRDILAYFKEKKAVYTETEVLGVSDIAPKAAPVSVSSADTVNFWGRNNTGAGSGQSYEFKGPR
jgi:hypothetical protein